MGYEINMVVLTWLLPQFSREERPSHLAYFLRQFCVVVTGVAIVTLAFLSPNWSQNKVYIAICEW